MTFHNITVNTSDLTLAEIQVLMTAIANSMGRLYNDAEDMTFECRQYCHNGLCTSLIATQMARMEEARNAVFDAEDAVDTACNMVHFPEDGRFCEHNPWKGEV